MAKATKLTLEKKVKIIKLNIKGKNATRGYLQLLPRVGIVTLSVSPHVSEAEQPDVNNGALASQTDTKNGINTFE